MTVMYSISLRCEQEMRCNNAFSAASHLYSEFRNGLMAAWIAMANTHQYSIDEKFPIGWNCWRKLGYTWNITACCLNVYAIARIIKLVLKNIFVSPADELNSIQWETSKKLHQFFFHFSYFFFISISDLPRFYFRKVATLCSKSESLDIPYAMHCTI